ncbi:tRNA glutamyl-Q(34) synthetase GluQRS [Luteimonas arsenica]|uniref:tRNA glutamyl-Q(34) synthetase GluQRS n=1 Tax=Luteimonas arsenica TaxID=1586242 RepID=UPI0010545DA0
MPPAAPPVAPTAPAAAPVRGRFAPSPTGPLHFGSLVAAFGSWLCARSAGGEWRIRVEDVDRSREVPGAAQAQLRSLAALGLDHDGPVEWQSRRGDLYAAALQKLLDAGLAFECHCSRADVAATGGIHRTCRPGARRPDPAMRLRVPDGCREVFDDAVHGHVAQDIAREVGDFVLRRADGYWAYQLAVVVDDADQGITGVVRGADLLDSTPRQLLLQRALGLPRPRYLHLPLVLDGDGRKLSKSRASLPVDDTDPLPALRMAWVALGQDPRVLPAQAALPALLDAAVRGFDPRRIPRGPLPATALHNAAATQGA